MAILIIGLGIFPGGTLSFINYKVITEGATDLSHKIPEHNKSYLVSVLDK